MVCDVFLTMDLETLSTLDCNGWTTVSELYGQLFKMILADIYYIYIYISIYYMERAKLLIKLKIVAGSGYDCNKIYSHTLLN